MKFLVPIFLALLSGFASAQFSGFLPNPDLLTVSPAFANAGSTIEVTITGKAMDEIETLRFADERIRVEPVRKTPDEFFPEGELVPNRFAVTIPEDVEPGVYEVRSLGYFGLSTARPFLVVEKDAKEIAEATDHTSPEKAQAIELNSGVAGYMRSKFVDWYRFSAKSGQRILIEAWAERLDSRGDAMLSLYDAAGRMLEVSRSHFGRDPFVDFTAPADGDFLIAVSDSLFRGDATYFYRLELSTGAHLDFAFPAAAEPGSESEFTLHGRNLPGGSMGEGLKLNGKPLETLVVQLKAPEQPSVLPGIFAGKPRAGLVPSFEHRVGDSNPVRIGFATAPVVREQPTEEVQQLQLPCEVSGRFDEPADLDVYRFKASKGQTWWIEVISERMGAMTDPYVLVEKIDGETQTKIAENDDPPSFYGPDALDDLNVDTLDPALSFTAEEDGEFQVTIVNRSAGGSLAHLYRLAIREAKPDFQLIAGTELTKTINNDAMPMAPLLRQGGSMIFRILAFRQDGFEGEIVVTAEGLPEGVTSPPLVMTGTTHEGYLTLQAAPETPAWSGPIRIVGRAKIGDSEIERDARSASIIWGIRVFGNQRQVRSRLDEEIVLSVIDSEIEPCRIAPTEDKIWQVELKQKLEIPIKIEDVARVGAMQVEVFGFPGLLRSPPKVSVPEGAKEARMEINFTPTGNFKPVPGKHQFVLQGIGNTNYVQNPDGAKRAEAEAKRIADLAAAAAEELKKAQAAGNADVAALREKVNRANALKAAADKAAKTAADLAKEKRTQFATYSLPITVEVVEPAK